MIQVFNCYSLLNFFKINQNILKTTKNQIKLTKPKLNFDVIAFLFFAFTVIIRHKGSFCKYFYYKQSTKSIPKLFFHQSKNINGISLMDERISQGRFHFEISFEIGFCSFHRLTQYSENGGVLFVSDGSYSMLVSNSMFYNCSSSGHGGAIYFNSINSTIQRVCANRCSCKASDDHYGQFANLIASNENNVDYASMSVCSSLCSGEAPIHLYQGNQRANNINSSLNCAFQCSGILIQSPLSFISSFCTFSNNQVSHSICIYFNSCSGILSFANIVHNNSPHASYGVVFVNYGSPKLNNCIFDMNQNTLFCVLSGGLEVSHSYISLTGALSISIAISIANNNSLSKKQTYQIDFFNSFYCNTDIPSRTTEGTIGETPKETLQRTYEDCSELYHTSDMKELSSIFSFQYLNQILILMIA